jgi:amino acid transporter
VQESLKTKGVLRLPQVVALYTGAVLGSGILILPGLAAELAGPASLIAWGLMALLVVPMALTMGLLSANYPDAGGVSSFVSKAFNPQIGSLIGWFFLLSVVIGAPVLALTGAGYVSAAAGLGDTARLLIAIAILATGIILNYLGMKMTGQDHSCESRQPSSLPALQPSSSAWHRRLPTSGPPHASHVLWPPAGSRHTCWPGSRKNTILRSEVSCFSQRALQSCCWCSVPGLFHFQR